MCSTQNDNSKCPGLEAVCSLRIIPVLRGRRCTSPQGRALSSDSRCKIGTWGAVLWGSSILQILTT